MIAALDATRPAGISRRVTMRVKTGGFARRLQRAAGGRGGEEGEEDLWPATDLVAVLVSPDSRRLFGGTPYSAHPGGYVTIDARGGSTMMRSIGVSLLALILMPAVAGAVDFDCEERALDLSVCDDPTDLSSCPKACVDPNDPDPDPATCAVLPLPELADRTRKTPDQPILRQVAVLEGPYTEVVLSRVALNALADGIFKAARDRLCVPPPPPPVCPSDGTSSSQVGRGPAWYGGDPGINVFFR